MSSPQVAVHENVIAVTEGKAHRVTIMDLITGDIVRRISGQGTAPGQLMWPTGITFTQRGEVFFFVAEVFWEGRGPCGCA